MELLPGSGLLMMRTAAFVEWLLMDAALTVSINLFFFVFLSWVFLWFCPVNIYVLQVRYLEMIVLLCGDSVHTASTCTAYWSGLILNKFNSIVQCADRNGSLKSDSDKISPSLLPQLPLNLMNSQSLLRFIPLCPLNVHTFWVARIASITLESRRRKLLLYITIFSQCRHPIYRCPNIWYDISSALKSL